MDRIEAERAAAELRRRIERHNRLYYVEARPEISDGEYDDLYRQLEEIEKRFPDLVTVDSPTMRVGGAPLKEFSQVRHETPMLSLEKAENLHELKLFQARIEKELPGEEVAYIVEPKVDGVSVGIRYDNGAFALGATRGDGITGDDITANLRTLRGIPLRLRGKTPELIEVRGEAYMRECDRQALNRELESEGDRPFPNTRNATAGSLKQLDPAVVARRRLRAVFYAIARSSMTFDTHAAELEYLKNAGLPVPGMWWRCSSVEEAVTRAEEMKKRESELPYEIDGAVIKVDGVEQARRLGFKAKAPASAIAYKPRHWLKQAATVLRHITVQVGRTGVLTPVAELEPVFLDGTMIARATLHNEDEIRRKDVRPGDTVVIERAGKVIPAVVRTVPEKRPPGAASFAMPSVCPACGSPVGRKRASSGEGDEVALRCDNLQCPAQKTRRIEHFAQRAAMDIEGLGGVVADKLVERGLAADSLDLFGLDPASLAALNLGDDEEPRVLGEKNAGKIIRAIEKSRSMPLDKWLFALAIPDAGEAISRQLAGCHKNLEEVAESKVLGDIIALDSKKKEAAGINPKARLNPPRDDAERRDRQRRFAELKEEIEKIRGSLAAFNLNEVGPAVARSVLAFFESEQGKRTLLRLRQLGIAPRGGPGPDGARDMPLAGKSFVLTGTLESMSRERAGEAIRALGGNVSSSVSSKTSFVVAGADPGSKLAKADSLGIRVLDEKAFLEMIKG